MPFVLSSACTYARGEPAPSYCFRIVDSIADCKAVNYASIMGMIEDTKMKGNDFSYLATSFYVSFFVWELPHGYLMQRLPTAKYLGVNGEQLAPRYLYSSADVGSHLVGHLCHYEQRMQELRFRRCSQSSAWHIRIRYGSIVCSLSFLRNFS